MLCIVIGRGWLGYYTDPAGAGSGCPGTRAATCTAAAHERRAVSGDAADAPVRAARAGAAGTQGGGAWIHTALSGA